MTMPQVEEYMSTIDRLITSLGSELHDLRTFTKTLENNLAEGGTVSPEELDLIGTRLAGFVARLEALQPREIAPPARTLVIVGVPA